MSDKTYNGWSNYETWNVNLWLDNEPGTYDEKREIVRTATSEYKAAQALKDWVEEMMPDLGATMWADLLGSALSEVDWDEIVEAEWKELHDDDEEED
jgi:hypothetical protein